MKISKIDTISESGPPFSETLNVAIIRVISAPFCKLIGKKPG